MSCSYRGGRPETITCPCGTVVTVGPRGRLPWRCHACLKKAAKASRRGEVAPKRPAHLLEDERWDERELGPEQPLLGRSEAQHEEWKRLRALKLYEEGLAASDIAERLGLRVDEVWRTLRKHGLSSRGDGREALPFGVPVQ